MKISPQIRALETLKAEEMAIKSLKKSIDSSFVKIIELIKKREGNIILTGIGKSGFIGEKIAATLTSLGNRSIYLHPVEALHGDIGIVSSGDILIALSNSGESEEILKLVRHLKKEFNTKVISLTKSKKNSLGKISDQVIEIKVKKEGCPLGVAPMASTTATLVMGDMLAAALISPDEFKEDNFAKFHPGGGLYLSLKLVNDIMKTDSKIPFVFEDSKFQNILKEINKKKLGMTGVLNNKNRLRGVITDGDIRRFLVNNTEIKNVTAKTIMTANPRCVSRNASLKEALTLMEKFKITTLFVVENKNKPVGVIHIHNILERSI